MSDDSKAGSKRPDPTRSGSTRSVLGDAGISRAPDTSLAAHESAQRFVERLSARTPETERYKDEGEIARGGMGAIVRVWDEVLRRTLAMKVLLEPPKSADDDEDSTQNTRSVMLARFVEEAQVTGQLDHPGIVPVHDVGVDAQGRVWFTMRLIKGRNLEEVLELVHGAREGWTTTRAVQVLLRVCEAMAFAHAKGVVHRDLKPANVMVGRFGETYVMDWGLARVAGAPEIADLRLSVHGAGESSTVHSRRTPPSSGASPHLTLAGSVVGTPAYMPPEQARGAIDEVDERSDVYAVGAMLYQLLAKHRPYSPPGTKLNALEVLRAVQAGPPEALATFAREAPAELVAICEKAMAREKEARYASMLLLAEDLQAYLEGRVVRAHRTGAKAELVKWIGRNKLAAAALVIAALLAVGGLGSIAWVQHEANAELAVARDAALIQSYGSNLSAASASLSLDAVDEARRRLAACDADLRGWEWSHLSLSASPRARELVVSNRSVDRVAWSPDGKTLATWCGDALAFWDVERGERRGELHAGNDDMHVMAWSPDGELVATAEPSHAITLWSVRDAKQVRVLAGHTSPVVTLRFSPDGKRLYSGAGNPLGVGWKSSTPAKNGSKPAPSNAPAQDDGRVFAWDVASGSLAFTLGAEGAMVSSVAVDASGRRLASVDREGVVRVWDVERRAALASRRFAAGVVRIVELETTGVGSEPTLLVVANNYGMQRWDAALNQVLASHEDAEAIAGLVGGWVLGPLHVATRRGAGNLRVFDRHDFTPVCDLHVGADEAESVAFDPSGRWIAFGGKNGVVTLWNPEVAAADYDLALPEWTVRGLAFTPDGERVVAGSTWGRLAVLDARTGATLVAQRIPRGSVRTLCTSRDGARVAVAHEKGLYVLRTQDLGQIAHAEGEWHACAFAGDAIVAGGADGTVAWIDGAASTPQAAVARASDAKHSGPVTCVVASADGSTCASGARDGSVIAWDARARRARAISTTNGGSPIVALALCEGAVIAADERGHLMRFDPSSGALLADVAAQEKPFVAMVAAPDGSRLYTSAQDGLLRVWQPSTLLSVATLAQSGAHVEELALSRDGARLACALDRGAIRVLESRARDLHDEDRARHIATQRRAKALVTELARELGSVRSVEERVAADASLSSELRAAALEPLRQLRDEARNAHRQSMRIAKQKDEGASAYRSALALAERAWRLEPEDETHLEALALATLRAGDPARALELLQATETKGAASPARRPGAAAIRALSLVRLGDREKALEEARRARELLKAQDGTKDVDARPIVIEAEAAVGAKAPK